MTAVWAGEIAPKPLYDVSQAVAPLLLSGGPRSGGLCILSQPGSIRITITQNGGIAMANFSPVTGRTMAATTNARQQRNIETEILSVQGECIASLAGRSRPELDLDRMPELLVKEGKE